MISRLRTLLANSHYNTKYTRCLSELKFCSQELFNKKTIMMPFHNLFFIPFSKRENWSVLETLL